MKTFLEIEQQLNMLFLEYEKLSELLTYPEVLLDSKLSVKLQKQQQLLNPIATKFNDYLNLKKSISEFEDLQKTLSGNDKNLINSELELSTFQLECLKQELVCMYLNLNAVVQNVVVEIVANKNAESEKLQSTIVSGYTQFCTNNAFSCNVKHLNNVSVLNISGLNALEVFKTEIGMHNDANNSKLIACQVFVYENVILPNLNFFEADVKISVCRSGGAGGQHVNTTNSMVKATHLPTGTSIVCQDERSQFQNKQKALESLKQKVETYYLNQHTKQTETIKREQAKQIKIIGPIKVYNFSNETITLPNGKIILLSQFLSGKVL